jgi:hypothetical protein
MDDPVANAILSQYFRRLEQALTGLPGERRRQIVEDLRAHIEESLADQPDRSDASVLAVLDRVGDPEEIVREAIADDPDSPQPTAPEPSTSRTRVTRMRVGASLVVAVTAITLALVTATDGFSPAAASRARFTTPGGLNLPPTNKGGWLSAGLISGDHHSPGASDCAPQTLSGSTSAATLESRATEVASGSVHGHSWSLWSLRGQSGGDGLENGGLVLDGVAHGLCPGFPNPAEMELLDPGSGGNGIAYGVVGYPGSAKINIYRSTVQTFDRGKLLASATAQVANGVGFFITALPGSACTYQSLEENTTSKGNSAEHNFGFSTSHCAAGQLVPISDSQGIWALPPGQFNNGPGGPGGGLPPTPKGGWLPAGSVTGNHHSPGASDCGPQTVTGSEPAATLEAQATQVASGTVAGHSWSLWSKRGQSGGDALENAGIVVDGVAHGLCPGFPNPAELELLDPSGGGNGIAYGVVGYPGAAKVKIYRGTVQTFDRGRLLAITTARVVNGVGFFVTALPASACSYQSLEQNTTSKGNSAEHNFGFSTTHCHAGQLVPINWSQGVWGGGGPLNPGPGSPGGRGLPPTNKGGWLSAGLISGDHHSPGASDCAPQTLSGSTSAATLESRATEVASGSVHGHSWSLWSLRGQSGGDGLENGGLVLDGVAHGLCPGFPNPAEMELLDPGSGGNGIAYGVVGYPGSAKINIYRSTVQTFDRGKLLASATAQVANGVGFFITALPGSACTYQSLEENTTSKGNSAEHNFGFSTSHCTAGQLVPISDSQGIWALPPGQFNNGG